MQEAGQSLPRARQGDDLEYFLPPIARPKVNTNYLNELPFPSVLSKLLEGRRKADDYFFS